MENEKWNSVIGPKKVCPPKEIPLWVRQENGNIRLAALHTSCSVSGWACVEYKDGEFFISDNRFLFKVSHWKHFYIPEY